MRYATAVLCNGAASARSRTLAALIAGQKTVWSVLWREIPKHWQYVGRGLQVGQTTLNHSALTLNWNANCIAWDSRHSHSILMTNTYSSWGLSLQNCGCVIPDLLTSDFGHIDNWRQKYCLIFLKSAKLIIYLQLHLQLQTTLDVQKAFCWTGSIKETQLSLIS